MYDPVRLSSSTTALQHALPGPGKQKADARRNICCGTRWPISFHMWSTCGLHVVYMWSTIVYESRGQTLNSLLCLDSPRPRASAVPDALPISEALLFSAAPKELMQNLGSTSSDSPGWGLPLDQTAPLTSQRAQSICNMSPLVRYFLLTLLSTPDAGKCAR